jgi:hypothetical protein
MVLESDGYAEGGHDGGRTGGGDTTRGKVLREKRFWCQRVTVMVFESNGYGVRE